MKPGSHPDTKMCSFLLHLNFTWPTFITGRPLHFLLDLLQNSAEAPPLAPEFAKISSVPVSACCVHTWGHIIILCSTSRLLLSTCCVHTWGHIIMLYYIMQTILCSTSRLLLSINIYSQMTFALKYIGCMLTKCHGFILCAFSIMNPHGPMEHLEPRPHNF